MNPAPSRLICREQTCDARGWLNPRSPYFPTIFAIK